MIALTGVGVVLVIVVVCLLCGVAVLAPLPEVPHIDMTEPHVGPVVLNADYSGVSWESSVTAELLSVGGVEVGESLHGVLRHGESDVTLVRQAMAIRAAEEPTWWGQPPCKDGRKRYVIQLADGRWAVWVLEPVSANVLQEVTAFVTESQDYVRGVRDNCGNGPWFGHALGID